MVLFCAIVMSGGFFRGETENLGLVDNKTYQQGLGTNDFTSDPGV